jgi:cobalt-zinc-cadmium efflux system protein
LSHHHCHTHEHTGYSLKTRFGFTIILNIIITITEYIGGFLSGSLALLSDATHNLSDVISLIFGYVGEKVSERKADLEYSFGLRRFEVITAVINALALWGIGIFIIYEAFLRWRNPVEIHLHIMLPIAAIGLIGNALSIFILGRHEKGINARAAFLHLLYDAVTSVAVIAAGLLIYFTGALWLDLFLSIAISVMMIASSLGILSEALRIFLQMAPRHIDADQVQRSIREITGANGVHGLHIWSVNSSEIFLSCHVCMDPGLKPLDNDAIIRSLNAMLKEKFGISHTAIQVEKGAVCASGINGCCEMIQPDGTPKTAPS